MHWLATKHVGGFVGMVFGAMAAILGLVANRKSRMGEPRPYFKGWVLPAAVAVLVAGCVLVCVAKI
jgi:multisubunit Na+/H+ antiporter MnhB subunit